MRLRRMLPEWFTDGALLAIEARVGRRGLARVVWFGLHCHADREGRFAWDVDQLTAQIVPLDRDITPGDLEAVLVELERAKRLIRYRVAGREYGALVGFSASQRPGRETASAIPGPLSADGEIAPPLGAVANGKLKAPSGARAVNREDEGPFVGGVELPVRGEGRAVWLCPVAFARQLAEAFPSVDVEAELRKAGVWLEGHAARRKTPRGMKAFAGNWISNAARHSGVGAPRPAPAPAPKQRRSL